MVPRYDYLNTNYISEKKMSVKWGVFLVSWLVRSSQEFTSRPLHSYRSNSFSQVLPPGVHVPPTPLIPLQLLLSGTPARSSRPAHSTHTAPTPSLRYFSQEFMSRLLHSYHSNSFSQVLQPRVHVPPTPLIPL